MKNYIILSLQGKILMRLSEICGMIIYSKDFLSVDEK